MKFPVVVEMTPLMLELSMKLLVVVEIVSTFVVPALITDCKLVVVATPLIVEVSIVPATERLLLLIIEEVDIDPPRLEVRVFTDELKVFGTVRLVTFKLVVVALVAVKLVKKPVTAFNKVENRLVVVAFVAVKEVVCILLALVIPVSIKLLS